MNQSELKLRPTVVQTTDQRPAINSLRIIVTAEIMYSSSYPASGFACSLTALGGDQVIFSLHYCRAR
jgi:type IV pilus assembly protein PilA